LNLHGLPHYHLKVVRTPENLRKSANPQIECRLGALSCWVNV